MKDTFARLVSGLKVTFLGGLSLFWLAPLAGAAIGALVWRYLLGPEESLANIGGDGEA